MESGDETSDFVSFEREGNTIRVRDEFARQRMDIEVDGEPTLQPALPDPFLFPVDGAVSVTASRIRIDGPHGNASAWDASGEHVGFFHDRRRELPTGTYFLCVTGAVLAYLQISDASVTTVPRGCGRQESSLEIALDGPSSVRIGARSLHTRPEATITIPDDPGALLEAMPYLSSSIREFSSERSWPTLRGHPPAIERGDEREIPARLEKPDTGLTIETPADYASLYRIAPLAFYLGADLVAGDRPALHLENGYTEPLETTTRSLEDRVDELLGRCLVLDSLVRTGGYLPSERSDYDEIAGDLSFYPPKLYGASLSSQLLEYLEVSESVLAPSYPCWPTTAVLRPEPADVELLPHLLHELARIQVAPSPGDRDVVDLDAQPEPGSSLVTSCTHASPPAGTCRLVPEAFEHVLERGRPRPGDARVAIATDDVDRAARFLADRDVLEEGRYAAEVVVVERPTRGDLERTFGSDFDFLYCDLPAAADGFACADGWIDPVEIDTVEPAAVATRGVGAPNAATTLVRRGGVVGLALDDAIGPRATIRFLSRVVQGFSLVECARLVETIEASAHRFVGIPSFAVVQSPGEGPLVAEISSVGRDEHEVSMRSSPTDHVRLGAAWEFQPETESLSRVADEYVTDGVNLTGQISRQPRPVRTRDVVAFLESDCVVRLNGRLVPDDEPPTRALVRESARRSMDSV